MYLLPKIHLKRKPNVHLKFNVNIKRSLHTKPTVTVALSGGVDSSISAYLLKSQGYNVNGIYMRNWSENEESFCSGSFDEEEVDKVCHFLKIPYRIVDFEKEYWNNVFQPSVDIYESGLTPNPDILCNREIKFKRLSDYVFERSSSDYIATGHYVRLRKSNEDVELLTGLDPNKDQSYFLLEVSQNVLKRSIFPVGHLMKKEVRELAKEIKLPNADRKESMGLCFIGKRKFDEFLNQYVEAPPGYFVDIDTKEVIGQHKGICFYTIGQNTSIPGQAQKSYVVKKDIESNVIYTCFGSDHPSLFSKSIEISYIHWISGKPPDDLLRNQRLKCEVKIRYRHQSQPCEIIFHNGSIFIRFDSLQKGATAGQYSGIYMGEVCLGGGPIKRALDEEESNFLNS